MKNLIAFVFLFLVSAECFSQNKLPDFPLSSVELLSSSFMDAQQTDPQYMLQPDPDLLLAPFLKEAGIPPKKENYGNWKNDKLPVLCYCSEGFA